MAQNRRRAHQLAAFMHWSIQQRSGTAYLSALRVSIVRHESGGRLQRARPARRAGSAANQAIHRARARLFGPASALATCAAGLEWGMRHLALAMRKCGHPGPHNYGLGGGCARTAYVRKVMASS